jgi:hypothetical protein
MGFGAMLLFIAILATATVTAIANSLRVRDQLLKTVTAATGAAGFSLAAIGLLHPVWAAVQVTFLFWLFAGISMRALALEREWAAKDEEA